MASAEDDDLTRNCNNLNLHTHSVVPVRANHRARNITHDFTKASKVLDVGQLIKDEAFSLFDSVQALEIMDPKMDTGFLQPGETLDDEYDVCRDLSAEQVLWIMDQLLCYEMAWHQGYPLAQNLLTSMYIYNLLTQDRLPEAVPYFRPLDGSSREAGPLVQNVLRAFCIGVIKSCDVVIEIVQTQQYYEEEDFNTHTFGLNLLTDIPDNEFFKINEDATEWLNHAKQRSEITQSTREALLLRLMCREHFMNLILPNTNPKLQDTPDSEAFRAIVDEIKSETSEACRLPVEEAFSSKLQRRLASTVPPRPVIMLDIDAACSQLSKIYEDIQEAMKMEALTGDMYLETLSCILWAFSAREPLTFPRAVLQMFLFNEGKFAGPGDGIKRLLIAHIRECVVAPTALENNFWDVEAPSDPRFQIARSVDFFVEQAAPEYINVFRSICQNRCRIRRCLTNVAKDVDNLASDFCRFMEENKPRSSKIVTTLSRSICNDVQNRLYKCIRLLLLQVCEWIVELGFEQNLYQQSEMPILGYYLSFVRNDIGEIFTDFMKSPCGSELSTERIETEKNQELMEERARYSLVCTKLWCLTDAMLSVLSNLCATSPVQMPYCTNDAQIELRMRPFMALAHGTPVDFSEHNFDVPIASLDLGAVLIDWIKDVMSMRTEVTDAVKAAKKEIPVEDIEGWAGPYAVERAKAMLKALVKISIALQALNKALEAEGGNPVNLIGKVSMTLDEAKLGYRWPVPNVAIGAKNQKGRGA